MDDGAPIVSRDATVMGYITKDGRLAAGYVVNTALPLRYFSFLPDQERAQLLGEPAESDFVEITCIWIDPNLVGYFDWGVVSHHITMKQAKAWHVWTACMLPPGAGQSRRAQLSSEGRQAVSGSALHSLKIAQMCRCIWIA